MAYQPDKQDRTDALRKEPPPPALTRLKKRADFVRARRGRRAVTAGLVLQCHPSGESGPPGAARVGYTATKKLGGAVVRNRVKRRLRAAAARVMADRARPGFDYVLIGRDGTATRPFVRLVADLEQALRQVHGAGTAPGKRVRGSRKKRQNPQRKCNANDKK